MMARSVSITALALVSLICATPAEADWVANCLRHVARETKRRNCWPDPFVCPDRYAVRAPFAEMVSNGWERQNMLGDHHFAAEDSELTEAAQLKIRWILTEAPPQHRTIYVHRADTAEETAVRIDGVRQFAAGLLPPGAQPLVLETSISDRGWPASQVDLIGRKYEASTPDPRLPAATGAGTLSE